MHHLTYSIAMSILLEQICTVEVLSNDNDIAQMHSKRDWSALHALFKQWYDFWTLAKEKVDEKILILFQMKELELEWVKIQGGP